MLRGTGTTSSVIQAAGAPSIGVSARPNALVVLVWTNVPTPAATASSSRTSVPVTFVSTNACRGWDIRCGLCSVAVCRTASAPAIADRTAGRSTTDATTSVCTESRRSRPTTSWPAFRRVRTSASPRCPALPVTRMRTGRPRSEARTEPAKGEENGGPSLVLGAVAEVGREPLLRLVHRPALAPRVVLDLVTPEAPEHEVPRPRMREVQPAHRGTRPHGHALGEFDAGGRLDVEELPDGLLLGVLGAGRVARCRPDAVVLLGDQPVTVEVLVRGVAPELLAHPLVQPLGERLGEPVGQRLEQDRAVVVLGLLERGDPLGQAETRGDGEGADVVVQARLPGRDEVRQGLACRAVPALGLLAQLVQGGPHLAPGLVGVDLDVLAVDPVGREQAEHPAGAQPPAGDQLVEHGLRVLVQPTGRLAGHRVVQQVGEPAAHLPRVEERLPVDVAAQLLERIVGEGAGELGDLPVPVVALGTGAD